MNNQLLVEITQENINGAIPNSSRNCPLGQALQKMYPKALAVVSEGNVHLQMSPTSRPTFWDIPDDAAETLARFDEGGKIEPLSLTLTWAKENEC